MGKIALVVPNNLWVCPYVSNYSRILDKEGSEYEIISWNRANKEERGIQYNKKETTRSLLGVLWSYFNFAGFVKRTLLAGEYDKVVVFSPQLAIFLGGFLKRHYKGRFIVDYRDLSIEQKPLFGKLFKSVLRNSYANVISSPGFKNYLPTGIDYVVCHNFNEELVKQALQDKAEPYTGKNIRVLTIGALRKDMNIEVIDALGNVDGVELSFVGKGVSSDYLESYVKEKGYDNISFTGYYRKEDEASIIKSNTFINIVYPLIPSHISALSNRFYNSLIHKRPMIVTKNTIQGDYAEKYGVGLVVENCNSLSKQLMVYRKGLDFSNYTCQCNLLLKIFLEDNKKFEGIISSFIMC